MGRLSQESATGIFAKSKVCLARLFKSFVEARTQRAQRMIALHRERQFFTFEVDAATRVAKAFRAAERRHQ